MLHAVMLEAGRTEMSPEDREYADATVAALRKAVDVQGGAGDDPEPL